MFLAEQWRESPMTDAIRLAWQTYASSVNWTNRLGEQVTLTGFNMFIRSNAALIAAGGTLVTAAPTDMGLPPGDPSFAVTASAATQKLSVAFDDGFDWLDETGAFLAIYQGMPQSASRNFFGGPWRFAGAIPGDDATPPTTPAEIDPAYTLTEGQKVWCQARIIRKDSRCSTLYTADPFTISA